MSDPPGTARQSTCVAVHGRGVLIDGLPGTGKSALALSLIDRGAMLVGDDSVMLEAREDRLFARPHPRTRAMLEVRNLGILPFPVCDEAPVALAILLDAEAPRYIDGPRQLRILGTRIPLLHVWPRTEPLAIKVELALACYGLPAAPDAAPPDA